MSLRIGQKTIDVNSPTYVIAELSANHQQKLEYALELIQKAKEAGVDAVKLQTYTPDTMTIDCDNQYFKIKDTIWSGQNLYQLYGEAYTPWEWHARLKAETEKAGLDFFSSPFDQTAVDLLESLKVPIYKIASFEITDFVLLKSIAQTGKPVIMSTGMATLSEIEEAIKFLKANGTPQIALLKCTSAYPAKPEDANLRTIQNMSQTFGCLVGLSDHTPGITVPIVGVSLGAKIVEKHLTLSRQIATADDQFSLEPEEFKSMVEAIRLTEKSLGSVNYAATQSEKASQIFRKSIFVTKPIKQGEALTPENIRVIRPGYGLHSRYYPEIIGKMAQSDLERGHPLKWKDVSTSQTSETNQNSLDPENFWKEEFGNKYIKRNDNLELYKAKVNMFKTIFSKISDPDSVIEFGSNIGLNLNAIEEVVSKDINITALEINEKACQLLKNKHKRYTVINSSILDYNDSQKYDFVLTCGFLIHLLPDTLDQVYDILYKASTRYICLIEYYNPNPTSLIYRGENNKLFKRDFAGEMLKKFKNIKLVDYGFIYSGDSKYPLDDLTWFLLEKE